MSARRLSLALALAAVVALPQLAAAQTAPLSQAGAQLFVPAPGRGNYLMVDGARVGGDLAPAFGLFIDYAHQPLVIHPATCASSDTTNCMEVPGPTRDLVRYLATAYLTGSITLFNRLQIGLVLPFSITDGQSAQYDLGGGRTLLASAGGFGAGFGDSRLSAKVRIYGGAEGIALAAVAYGTIPLGQFMEANIASQGAHFLGNGGPMFGGHAVAEYNTQKLHVSVNVGGFWLEDQHFLSSWIGSRFTYGAGIGYDFTPLVGAVAELTGQTDFKANVDRNPVEARLAARLTVGDFQITLGGGVGLVQGYGEPVFRVLGGVAYVPDRSDSDGDGVIDAHDSCPNEAEDHDGFDDEDGCPDADNDNDGFLDARDQCPDEAEDRDNFQDTDGCPDTDNDHDGTPDGFDACPEVAGDHEHGGCPDLDHDHDGIPDTTDHCPNEPEDTDGFCDDDGCPETDCDHDGLTDDNDQCPDQAENFNRYQDEDGCPDEVVDTDHDGIADPVDHCPNEPETLNGVNDTDGCPDGAALVRVEGNNIILLQQVNFRTNSATITGRRSFTILDVISSLLRGNPEYQHVNIEGHTDGHGDHDANVTLSRNRAQACLDYLVQHASITPDRLSAEGFGPDRPLDPGTGRRADAANRRVEFHIVEAPAGTIPVAPPAPPPTPTATDTPAPPPEAPATAPAADGTATPPATDMVITAPEADAPAAHGRRHRPH